MSYKKFENGDLFYNTIKAKPRFEFKICNGKAIVNGGISEAALNSALNTPPSAVVVTGCPLPNSFDFSCEENSYNLSII